MLAFIILRCGICTFYVMPHVFYFFVTDIPAPVRYGIFITYNLLWVWSMQIAWRMVGIINHRAAKTKKMARFKIDTMVFHFVEWVNPIGDIEPDFSEDSD